MFEHLSDSLMDEGLFFSFSKLYFIVWAIKNPKQLYIIYTIITYHYSNNEIYHSNINLYF